MKEESEVKTAVNKCVNLLRWAVLAGVTVGVILLWDELIAAL